MSCAGDRRFPCERGGNACCLAHVINGVCKINFVSLWVFRPGCQYFYPCSYQLGPHVKGINKFKKNKREREREKEGEHLMKMSSSL